MQIRPLLSRRVKVIKLSKKSSTVPRNKNKPSVVSQAHGNSAKIRYSVIENMNTTELTTSRSSNNNKKPQQPNIQLLKSIIGIFKERKASRLRTRTILSDLSESAFCNGKEICSRRLAFLLKTFGIHSRDIRFISGVAKGYMKESFTEAASRYK